MHHINHYQRVKHHATMDAYSKFPYIALLVLAALLAISSPVIAMPDLTIESISGAQTSYNVGEAMPIFKVRVKNIGDAPIPKLKKISVELKSCTFVRDGHASSCKSEFMADAESASPDINGLTAGSVVDIRWPLLWPGMPTHSFKEGDYKLVFKVSALSEASYGNNEYTLNISATYPGVDSFVLTMQGIDYVGPCPKGNIDIAKGSIFVTHGSGYIDYHYVTSITGENPHTYSKAVNNKETITLGMKSAAQQDMDGWVAVKVTSPYPQMSEKGYFKIRCNNPDAKKKLKLLPKSNLEVLPKKKLMLK
jgi:hypothetical protein